MGHTYSDARMLKSGETPNILVLAGGSSSRMRGADKLMEPVDGVPLIRLQVMNALTLGLPVYVALPHPDHARAEAIADLPATQIIVPEAAEGMSGTLRGAVAQIGDATCLLVFLPDLVELTANDLAQIIAAKRKHPDHLIWRGATVDGKPGHPVLFDKRLLPEFADLRGDTGGEAIVKKYRAQTHLIPLPDERARLDLDTPEAWTEFRERTGR